MNDLIQDSLKEVLEKLADVECDYPACPIAADDAFQALDRDVEYQLNTMKSIAENGDFEPWAANVASNWLKENGYEW